jgi:hypothetical protein
MQELLRTYRYFVIGDEVQRQRKTESLHSSASRNPLSAPLFLDSGLRRNDDLKLVVEHVYFMRVK